MKILGLTPREFIEDVPFLIGDFFKGLFKSGTHDQLDQWSPYQFDSHRNIDPGKPEAGWVGNGPVDFQIGQKVGDMRLKIKILSVQEEELQAEVIALNDTYYQRYVDLNGVYRFFKHTDWEKYGTKQWECDPTTMKREVSQLLLTSFDKGASWSFELDM